MADPLQIELVAADRVVWSGEASEVIARTVDGDLGVLAGHAPLLSLLIEGVVKITPLDGSAVIVAVEDGFISVANNRVSILSEDAHLASEIDFAAAKSERDAAQADGDSQALRRADAKIRAVEINS